MKNILWLFAVLVLTSGCEHLLGNMISNSIRNKSYFVIKDVSNCTLLDQVTTWYAYNSRKIDHAPIEGYFQRFVESSRF